MEKGASLGYAGKVLRETEKLTKKKHRRLMRMIKREEKINLTVVGNNTFQVTDRNGNIFSGFGASDNFFIYFKNVNFKKNGTIEGRYLGKASDSIVDGQCKEISFKEDLGFVTNGDKVVRTARMVSVNNKTRALIIIEN